MIAALLLAATTICGTPTLPSCSPDLQQTLCGCAGRVAWDASPGADFYRVRRTTVSTGYEVSWTSSSTSWHAQLDSAPSYPRPKVLYRIEVQACNAAGCSAWAGPVFHVGQPIDCVDLETGEEVQCYPFDRKGTVPCPTCVSPNGMLSAAPEVRFYEVPR